MTGITLTKDYRTMAMEVELNFYKYTVEV